MSSPAPALATALHPLLAPISYRLLELEAELAARPKVAKSLNGESASEAEQVERKQFVLVLLDSAQVSSYLGYSGGRAVARAVANLVEVVMADIDDDIKSPYSCFVIHPTSSSPRASALELAQGFEDGCLSGSFGFVSSREYAERKVAALLELHGLLNSCIRVIASKQFKSTVDAAGAAIVSKAFYLQDEQLGEPDLEPSECTEAEGNVYGDGLHDSFGSSASREAGPSNGAVGGLAIDPNLPIQAQQPRICTSFALQRKCVHGSRCKHSHAYFLTATQEASLRATIKKVACVSVKGRGVHRCPYGEECLYGHVCPDGVNCTRGSRCYYQGEDCHLGPPSHESFPTSAFLRSSPRGGGGYGRAARGGGGGRGRGYS